MKQKQKTTDYSQSETEEQDTEIEKSDKVEQFDHGEDSANSET